MGSVLLNVNNRILINRLQSAISKNVVLQQRYRGNHVFAYKTSNYYALQFIKTSNFKKIVPIRLASTNVNITDTPVEISSNVTKTISSQKPSIFEDSEKFFIVDQNKKVEVVSNVTKPEHVIDESLLPPAPLPPGSEPTTGISEFVSQLAESGAEPTLKSLGLGSSYTPPGWLQLLLEYLHVDCGLPWWGAITLVTVVLRLITVPVFLHCRKFAVRMSNHAPKTQEFQIKILKARQAGNMVEAATLQHEMMKFYKDNNINPLKGMLPMLTQAPLFMSFFYALRSMANHPVESMKEGGLFWFMDLTVPDQFYLLPLTTSVTLWLMFEFGSETVKLSEMNNIYMKYFLRGFPFAMMFITVNFPSAVLCYWTATNAFSFAQIGLLKVDKVREAFGIPVSIKHNPENLPLNKKNMVQNIKDSIANAKSTSALANRERLNAQQFAQAGRKPLERTFKKNPLLAKSAKDQ